MKKKRLSFHAFRRRPAGWSWPHPLVFWGLGLGFVGVGAIVLSKSQHGGNFVDIWGASVLLVSSLCWAAGSVFSRRLRQSESALLGVAMQMISGGLLLLLCGLATGEANHFDFHAVTGTSFYALIYLTVFGSLVGFTAYVWLLRVSTPARVATYAYVNPLIAVILGRLVLGEKLPDGMRLAILATMPVAVAVSALLGVLAGGSLFYAVLAMGAIALLGGYWRHLSDAARSVAITLISHRPDNFAASEIRLQRCDHLMQVLDAQILPLGADLDLAQMRATLAPLQADACGCPRNLAPDS